MRLTRQCEIAIAILTACAGAPGKTLQTVPIAKAAGTSRDYAANVVRLLAQEGFVRTGRGRNGGISLAVPATEIFLGDVLRRVQPDFASYAEPKSASVSKTGKSVFAMIVEAAEADFMNHMDQYSVADIISHPHKPQNVNKSRSGA